MVAFLFMCDFSTFPRGWKKAQESEFRKIGARERRGLGGFDQMVNGRQAGAFRPEPEPLSHDCLHPHLLRLTTLTACANGNGVT